MIFSIFLNSISRFAVPCFVMLAGAFALSNPENADYKYYYKKIFNRIGIPTIIFSLAYFLFLLLQKVLGVVLNGKDLIGLLTPFVQWAKGAPYYHMWYLYMMIGIYIITPVVISIKNKMNEDIFIKCATIFAIIACISGWTSTHYFYWDIGFQFQYLGYYLIGFVIYSRHIKWKVNPYVCLFSGFILEFIAFAIRINLPKSQITNLDYLSPVSNFSPFIAIGSILIFMGISGIQIKHNKYILGLSKLTFYIYLFQQGVWTVVSKFSFNCLNTYALLLICPIVVFCISAILSYVYIKRWNQLNKDDVLIISFQNLFIRK